MYKNKSTLFSLQDYGVAPLEYQRRAIWDLVSDGGEEPNEELEPLPRPSKTRRKRIWMQLFIL